MSRAHGRVSTYRDGCRCDLCREAKSVARRPAPMNECDCGRLYEGDRTSCRYCRSNMMRGVRLPVLHMRPLPAPWMADASCRDMTPGLFFPGRGRDDVYNHLRLICYACKVRQECLDDCLAYEGSYGCSDRYGMRGGCTPAERAREARDRAAVAVDA